MTDMPEKLIYLCVSLILLTAAISVAFLGLYEGKTFFSSQEEQIERINTAADVEFINTLDALSGQHIPVVAAYKLLTEHSEMCSGYTCDICGQTVSGEQAGQCLLNHASGRVFVTYERDPAVSGLYIFHVRN